MNRTKLKNYAPQARRDFIQAMTDRAAYYGLTDSKTEPVVERGDVAVIAGREHPRAVVKKRRALEDRIKAHGFEQTMEALAYTWFNRLVAIRFMELHGYLDHGYRVLSPARVTTDSTNGTDGSGVSPSSSSVSSVKSVVQSPEILVHAEHVDLPGLKKEAVIDLKLAGNKEPELYRFLLTAQCNALHSAMPFLFERIDDETELLLPDNLLHSDSLIRKLVNEIDEDDWNEVEIIGWLYQFYISEKKDAVIGKVVASEDIPAATQLFTPNWIVKYLVQNTLGRLWLEHHPNSPLKAKMEYYIEPAEQTPEVQEQLQQIIRRRALENRGLTTDHTEDTDRKINDLSLSVSSVLSVVDISLNPEHLTLLDPACGSGHILVEAYDLFKAIYQERGYRAKDIPALILQKNLFGLEIDDRAAQLAAFALLMKARADDRRLFELDESGDSRLSLRERTSFRGAKGDKPIQPHVMALVETKDMDAAEIADAVSGQWGSERRQEPPPPPGHLFEKEDNLFTRAATKSAVTSTQLTTGNGQLTADIRQLIDLFAEARTFGSLIQVPPELAARLPLLEQRVNEAAAKGELSRLVAIKFQPVVEQARLLARQYDCVVANPPYMGGRNGMNQALKDFAVAYHSDSKSDLFAMFIERGFDYCKTSGMHGMVTMQSWMFLSSYKDMRAKILGSKTLSCMAHLGNGVMGIAFGTAATVIINDAIDATFRAQYSYCRNSDISDRGTPHSFPVTNNRLTTCRQIDFNDVPGTPIAYWVTQKTRQIFRSGVRMDSIASPRQGLATGDNERFLRFWHEVSTKRVLYTATSKEDVFATNVRWVPYSKGGPARKWYGNGEHVISFDRESYEALSQLGNKLPSRHLYFKEALNWSLTSSLGFAARYRPAGFVFDVNGMSSFMDKGLRRVLGLVNSSVGLEILKIINPTMAFQVGDIKAFPCISIDEVDCDAAISVAISLARTDWDSFETSWDFQTLPVLRDQGTDAPRSAGRTLAQSQAAADAECLDRFQRMKQLEEENNRLFIDAYGLQDELSPEVPDDQITLYRPDREQDIQRLISYALGCLMGRYSLDQPGLIYAGGEWAVGSGQWAGKTERFPVDPDGIVPLTETDWFPDDAANRFIEFLRVAWPKEQLEENLKFVAESLGPNKDESPRETLRRYLATGFYKQHLQTYKRRPIYWLFSSGKQRAFQCLVYLHRYHEGTLARMRTEYVIPLQSQLAARIEQLEGDKSKATSTSYRKKLQKEQDDLKKQQTELLTFEEKLKHAADQKITLDLDDGVKVNYAKFGDLLAEVKAVCGTKDDE